MTSHLHESSYSSPKGEFRNFHNYFNILSRHKNVQHDVIDDVKRSETIMNLEDSFAFLNPIPKTTQLQSDVELAERLLYLTF